MTAAQRTAWVAAGTVSTVTLSILLAGPTGPRGRKLGATEIEVVLPALARTNRPALHAFRDPADAMLEAAQRTGEDVYLVAGRASVGKEVVDLPEGFDRDLARMTAAVDRVRGAGTGLPLSALVRPPVVAALRQAWAGMRASEVKAKGIPYRVTRQGLLVEDGGRCRVDLAPEPVLDAVREMSDARGQWDVAFSRYHARRELWAEGDPHHLFDQLETRDRARGYDAAQRATHLELVLDAVIPNLVESVATDLGALLEMAVEAGVARPTAVVSVREDTDLNRMSSFEDQSFARRVAPLHVVLFRDDGSARLLRLSSAESGLIQEEIEIPAPG